MTGTRDQFVSFSCQSFIYFVSITDGSLCLVGGQGSVQVSLQFTISFILTKSLILHWKNAIDEEMQVLVSQNLGVG